MDRGNPILKIDQFDKESNYHNLTLGVMTFDGTINKIGILLLILIASSIFVWGQVMAQPSIATIFLITGLIGGLIMSLVTIFKKDASPITVPIYTVCQGLFIGSLSAIFETMYPGLIMQAVLLTFGTLLMMLFLYKSGFIKVTEKFRFGIIAATGGIAIVYILSFMLSFFKINLPFFQAGLIGIAFSLFVVGIAALNLILDFDFIENASQSHLPKYMEWFGAFGLIVTLIWLYIEILRLLIKLRSRD